MSFVGGGAGWWPEERFERAKILWLEGKSAREVMVAVNTEFPLLEPVSRNSILGKMFRAGLTSVSGEHRVKPAKPARLKTRTEPSPAIRAAWGKPAAASKPPRAFLVHPTPEASEPRPWTERRAFQCAFPIDGPDGETWSCCAKTGGTTYCPDHQAIMFQPRSPHKPVADWNEPKHERHYGWRAVI